LRFWWLRTRLPVMTSLDVAGDLLTTGQAAVLLGCSRQHVVDLCERGALPCATVGMHRRLARVDVERFARGDEPAPPLTRDQVRSLWLHRAVAGRLAADPDAVLGRARATIDRWLAARPPGGATNALERWREVADDGPEAVMEMLVSPSPAARELRQSSPFTRVLSEAERQSIIRSFHRHWLGQRAG
jgi:excisionase family DNA binding protein